VVFNIFYIRKFGFWTFTVPGLAQENPAETTPMRVHLSVSVRRTCPSANPEKNIVLVNTENFTPAHYSWKTRG
jgi:hypothetical protein